MKSLLHVPTAFFQRGSQIKIPLSALDSLTIGLISIKNNPNYVLKQYHSVYNANTHFNMPIPFSYKRLMITGLKKRMCFTSQCAADERLAGSRVSGGSCGSRSDGTQAYPVGTSLQCRVKQC